MLIIQDSNPVRIYLEIVCLSIALEKQILERQSRKHEVPGHRNGGPKLRWDNRQGKRGN